MLDVTSYVIFVLFGGWRKLLDRQEKKVAQMFFCFHFYAFQIIVRAPKSCIQHVCFSVLHWSIVILYLFFSFVCFVCSMHCCVWVCVVFPFLTPYDVFVLVLLVLCIQSVLTAQPLTPESTWNLDLLSCPEQGRMKLQEHILKESEEKWKLKRNLWQYGLMLPYIASTSWTICSLALVIKFVSVFGSGEVVYCSQASSISTLFTELNITVPQIKSPQNTLQTCNRCCLHREDKHSKYGQDDRLRDEW